MWARTHKGDGVNLALATDLTLNGVIGKPERYELRAWWAITDYDGEQPYSVLDQGSENEMKDARAAYLAALGCDGGPAVGLDAAMAELKAQRDRLLNIVETLRPNAPLCGEAFADAQGKRKFCEMKAGHAGHHAVMPF